MPFHQYSRLFTSGLLSESELSSSAYGQPQPRRHTLSLKPTDPESPKPTDQRPCSFLELSDSFTSPGSVDPSSPWCFLGHRVVSVSINPTAIRKLGPAPLRRSVLASTSLNATVPPPTADSPPRLTIPSRPAGHSLLIAESPLPDSPTLARGPSLRTVTSTSASSASLSVTSETKRVNRSVALACLEGREGSSTRIPRKSHSNFMSMSDDDDEDDSLAPSSFPSMDRAANKRLSAITVSNIPSSGEKEAESFSSDQQSKAVPVRSRHRSRTMESWFPPLANFIDLRNEEDPPNWRSFIELSPMTA